MALSSFSVSAKGLDGIPYRVDVNGGGTAVTGDGQFLVIEGGEEQDRGLDPVWPKRLRLFMREDVDLSPLFGEADRAVDVAVQNVTGGTDTLAYRGFMVTDFYSDAPFEPKPLIELQALDGLGTLENDSLSAIYSGGTEVSVKSAITSILSTLYPLEVEVGTEWYPDAGGSLGASDNPLEDVKFTTDNYREERPDGDAFQSQLAVLRDLCIKQGLVVKQVERPGGARWLVAQRSAYNSDGTLKVWTYDTTGSLKSGEPSTRDRSLTLDVNGQDLLKEHTREFVRRRQRIQVTHNHVEIGQINEEGGFEDGGSSWELKSVDTSVSIDSHDDYPDKTPDLRQENKKLAFLEASSNTSGDQAFPLRQNNVVTLEETPAEAYLSVSQDYALGPTDPAVRDLRLKLAIEDGGTTQYLTNKTTNIVSSGAKGKGSIPVEAIDRAIPAGALLPIEDPTFGTLHSITLSQRAPAGATKLVGEISAAFSSGWVVHYADWTTTDSFFALDRIPGLDWGTRSIFADLSGIKGELSIWYGTGTTDSNNRGSKVWLDDVEVNVERLGQPLDQTSVNASVQEFGEEEAQTARTFSGPTDQNLARLRADGFKPTNWGIGVGGGSLSLAELKARERLRYWRNHNEMFSVTGVDRDGTTQLTGDELVTLDGQTYTVHSIKYDAAKGETELTLIEYEDRGTSGITLETVLEQSEGAAGSTSGGSGGAVGGGGGGGTAIEVIQLDASGGNVTETLPSPEDGAQVLYIRVDDDAANTATIEDPNGNVIYIFSESREPTYHLDPRERVFLVSDGTNWYVEDFRGSSVVILDATDGSVTEPLPAPKEGRTAIALRADDTSNSATLTTANPISQEIRFAEGKNVSSTDLRPEQSLFLTSDGTHWYVEEGQGLRAEAEDVTSDGGTKESPRLTQTATYDSNGTTSVTSSDVSIERYVRTDTDGNATLVYEHDGTEIARLTDEGRLETRKDQEAFMDGSLNSGQGTNSLLQVEDGQGDVLTTDAASLQFTGSGVSVTEPNPDEIVVDVSGGSGSDIDIEQNQTPVVGGATGLSFEGSGIDDVTNDGDGTATVSISKGSSTEVQEGGTAQVSDVTVLDFVGGDFSVANPTSGEAEVSLQNDTVTVAGNSVPLGGSTGIAHGDLSSIGSSDHHARPSAGDGLSESSNTFSVNESQVDHDSLNQFVGSEHVDHSAVTISAGTALSGGGDLTASRTLNVAGPFTGIPFKTSGDNLEWQAEANTNDLILKNTTASQTLLKVDQDTGTVFAAGDVVAFGLSGGSGTGSSGGFSIAGDGLTSPDGETVEVDIGPGLTINNGVLEADGSVGVSSVFGRTGDVTASAGDYSASQISNFDAEAVNALQAHDGTGVDADTLDGVEGSNYARTDVTENFGGDVTFGSGATPQSTVQFGDHRSTSDVTVTMGRAGADRAVFEWNRKGAIDATIGMSQNEELLIENNFGGPILFQGNAAFGGETAPSYAVETAGDMRATGEVEAFLGSDRRLKKHLDPLGSALDKVDALTGYGFDWREEEAVQPHKRGMTDVGLIAQEVEGVLPEAVKTFSGGHSEGYKSVSYDKLVPLLVEAIKDLRNKIEE